MFYKGLLDTTLQDKCRALDPSFEFDELRFIREEFLRSAIDAPGVPAHLPNIERQKLLADFLLLEAELTAEGIAWQGHLTRMAEIEDSEAAARILLRERQQDALMDAVSEHQQACYRTICLSSVKKAPAFLESSLGTFRAVPHAGMQAHAWRINIVNCCSLGLQASTVRSDIAEMLSADHSHHPETTFSIVILPNTPEWGGGQGGKKEKKEPLILEARKAWQDKLQEPSLALEVKAATAMWDESLLVSAPDRELPIPMLLIVSNLEDASGKLRAEFTRSNLWRRRAVSGHIAPMSRSDYSDWAKPIPIYDSGNMDKSLEKRQACTGVPLYSALLRQSFAGMAGMATQCCHVRDFSRGPSQIGRELQQPARAQCRAIPVESKVTLQLATATQACLTPFWQWQSLT